jgi:hypothetical protein
MRERGEEEDSSDSSSDDGSDESDYDVGRSSITCRQA